MLTSLRHLHAASAIPARPEQHSAVKGTAATYTRAGGAEGMAAACSETCYTVWDVPASNGQGTCGNQILWEAEHIPDRKLRSACRFVAVQKSTPECAPCNPYVLPSCKCTEYRNGEPLDADLACHVFEDPRWVCYPPKYDPNYVAPTQDHEPWYCPPDQALCSQLVPPPAPPSPSPHSPPPLPFPPPPPPPSPPEPSPPPPHPIASPPPAPSPPPPFMPPDTPIVHLTPRKPSLPSVQAEEKAFTPSGAANAANGADAAITIEHDVVVVTSAASPSPPKWPAPDPPSAQAPARTIEIASAPPPVFPASLPPPSNPTVVYGGEALHIAGSTWHVSRLQQYFPYFVAAVVTPVASLTVVFGGFMYFVCRRRQKRSASQRSVGGPEVSFRSSAHNKGFVDEQKRAPRGADGLSAVTNAIFIERLQEAVLLPAESQHVDDDDESCVLLCDDTTNGTLPYDSTHGGTHDDAQYDDAQYDDAQRHGAPTGNTGSCTCNGVPHAQPLLQAREDRRAWDGGGHSHASVETSAVRDLDAEASAIFAMVQGDEI